MSAGTGSFSGGLLEAAGLSTIEHCSTLLVSYDLTPPETLTSVVPIEDVFACALIIGNEPRTPCLAKLQLALNPAEQTKLNDNALESLRSSNPAARALPLLKAIAGKQAQTVVLPYLHGQNVSVTCTPWL
jgi:hypothetical protein